MKMEEAPSEDGASTLVPLERVTGIAALPAATLVGFVAALLSPGL